MSTIDSNPLVGTWHGQEETLSSVDYTVSFENGAYSVSAIDTYDDEPGQIYDVKWDDQNCALLFCCYWESSGRFAKCKLSSISDDKAEFVYQYTDHEILVKT